jgi:hypothetical protein
VEGAADVEPDATGGELVDDVAGVEDRPGVPVDTRAYPTFRSVTGPGAPVTPGPWAFLRAVSRRISPSVNW